MDLVIHPEFQRDLETEKRKAANLQESLKESEKEYHKLKVRPCRSHPLTTDNHLTDFSRHSMTG